MHKFFVFLYLSITVNIVICQVPIVLWENNYDNNKQYDLFQSVKQTSDSNFICCGTTLGNFWLVKVDKNGNVIWNKSYGPKESNLSGQGVIEFGGSYYGVGEYNDDQSDPGVLVIKYNANGRFIWMKNYEYYHTGVLGSNSYASAIVKTTDNNFMIAASCFYITESIGTEDIWLLKVNLLGDTLWTKRYDLGFQYYDTPNSIIATPDSGFVLVGQINGPYTSPTLTDLFIMKVDKYGNKLWQKIYGGSGWDAGFDVKMTKDNGLIIVGQIGKNYSNYEQDSDLWLLKTDEKGDTLWTKTIGTYKTEYGNAIELTKDNGYIITGTNEKIVSGSRDIWVVRTDSLGDTLWTKTFGDSVLDIGYSVFKTYDNGYIVGGYSGSFESNSYDGYLIRFGPENLVSVENRSGKKTPNVFKLYQNYPNPFNPSTTINYQLPNNSFVELKIYNILGEKIAELVKEYKVAGYHSIKFNSDKLSCGMYLYKIQAGEFSEVKKMLLLK